MACLKDKTRKNKKQKNKKNQHRKKKSGEIKQAFPGGGDAGVAREVLMLFLQENKSKVKNVLTLMQRHMKQDSY